MDIDKFAENLGHFVAYMASRKQQDEGSAVSSLRAILQDSEAATAFESFCETAGIDVMKNGTLSVVRVFPNGVDSPFSYDAEDFKKGVKGDDRSMYAFAMLCTLATFYPSRAAINQGHRAEVTTDTVIAMVREMTDYADSYAGKRGSESLPVLADRFKLLSDDTGETTRNRGFKSTYVESALRQLKDHGLVKVVDGGKYYMPTEALRLLAVDRITALKGQLSQILSEFHDAVEAGTDEDVE